jgi:hypothetical protein
MTNRENYDCGGNFMSIRNTILAVSLIVGLVACAGTGDNLPAQTDDGLTRVDTKRVDAAYMAPGADLGQYEVLYIREVEVSFVANWLRDTNRSRGSISSQLTQADADNIKRAVADSFQSVFTERLRAAGYVVLEDKSSAGAEDDILVLVPAIIDLDVAAPDKQTAGRSRSYVTSAGSMTLQMELLDGLTSALIARVSDDQESRDYGTVQVANSVTNKAEAERIFRRWADLLVKALDRAHGK